MVNRKVRHIRNSSWIADIPKAYAIKMGLQHRETVSITYENDAIVIRKISKNEPSVPTEGSGGAIYGK